MKNETPKEKKNVIYVRYSEECQGGEAESDEPYSSRSDEHCSFSIEGASTTNSEGLWSEATEVDFDVSSVKECFVLVIRYGTGDSFGHTSGRGMIEGVYHTQEFCTAIGKAIKEGYDAPRDPHSWHKDYTKYRALKNIPKAKYISMPWEGYFESLEDIEIHHCKLDAITESGFKVIRH